MNAIIQAGKTIFASLAFANADNYSEFRKLLRQTGDTGAGNDRPTQSEQKSGIKDRTAISATILPIQRAL
jgi:hypothetical protein